MPWSEPGGLPSFDRWRPSAAERSGAHGRARRAGEAGGRRLGTGAVAPASRGNRARVDAEVRVPTRSVRKYTPRAQLKPLGAPEPASGARETGGGGRPARLCQEETHVLAEQFGTTEQDGRSTVQQDVLQARP